MLLIQRGAKATSLSSTLILLLAIKHTNSGCNGSGLDKGGRVHVLKRKGDLLTRKPTDRLRTPKTREANQAPHVLPTLRTRADSFLYLINAKTAGDRRSLCTNKELETRNHEPGTLNRRGFTTCKTVGRG
ncbi:hypothetical protein Bca4012_018879 [Brassica carinata]